MFVSVTNITENCPEISDPDNGIITSGESPFYHLEVVTFECSDNFTLIGQSEIMCNNGAFDNDPPICSGKLHFHHFIFLYLDCIVNVIVVVVQGGVAV